MIRDIRNFVVEFGVPFLVGCTFYLALYFVLCEAIEPVTQFVRDVHTVAEDIRNTD